MPEHFETIMWMIGLGLLIIVCIVLLIMVKLGKFRITVWELICKIITSPFKLAKKIYGLFKKPQTPEANTEKLNAPADDTGGYIFNQSIGNEEFHNDNDIEPIELLELAYNYDKVQIATIDKTINFSAVVLNQCCKLEHEPNNEYDSKAVAVYFGNIKIGYLKKNRLQDMYHDYAAKGGAISCYVAAVEEQEIYVRLEFYRRVDAIKFLEQNCETKVFKLTGNKSEECQENISFASEGDEIWYSWDFEKNKYGSDVGFFPKAADEYLERNAPAYVYDIECGDDGKYNVTAIVKTK